MTASVLLAEAAHQVEVGSGLHAASSERPLAAALGAEPRDAAGPWVLALGPRQVDPTIRSEVAAGLARAQVGRFGWLVLRTCQRVEVLGVGPRPSPATLADLVGVPDAARVVEHAGPDAARHVLRLATGLDSAVTGEDQVLGQIRRLRRSADGVPGVGGRLVGLLDLAIHVGRRARAERPRSEHSLADRATAWLEAQRGFLVGSRMLVVGSGPIGREAARIARRAGASLVVASRSGRATWASAVGLDEAARLVPSVDAVIVALAGPWPELLDARLSDTVARQLLVVDLSSPPAVPAPMRARLRGRLITLADLVPTGAPTDPVTVAYVRHTERLVEEALERLGRRAVPDLGPVITALRDGAEVRRTRELQALLHSLPDLDHRQRAAIDRSSRRLVAGVVHGATLALRGEA